MLANRALVKLHRPIPRAVDVTDYRIIDQFQLKAGVNLKFAQKLSFLFSSEFAALGIKLCYGKIIFHLFSLFLPF